MKLISFIFLLPFSLLYLAVAAFRNHLYDIGYSRSFSFEKPVIGVGNLNVGGSGKTPMVELIIRILSPEYAVATLSRGYKRKTRNFRIASEEDTAESIGDEPYQFYRKFGDRVTVAVGEQRAWAIPQILFERPETQAIILDDAFQHRSVQPRLNILLCDYYRPFYNDFVLPAGRLRESRKGARRADAVVVTKCPSGITADEMERIRSKLTPYLTAGVPVFFAGINYEEPQPVFSATTFHRNILLFSGIAGTTALESYAKQQFNVVQRVRFPDHFEYNEKSVHSIIEAFEKIDLPEKSLLTTEKDMVKLVNLHGGEKLKSFPLFYLPIRTVVMDNGRDFADMIKNSIKE